MGALGETLEAESLTRVLYPDDSTAQGQGLRFLQEYFLVACSLADLVRRFQRHNSDWNKFPEKAAIQLNDTHPSMSVAELMRILLDDVHLGWDQAWDLTKRTLGYTNHTLLPEALEKWPVAWFETLIPRHLEIIYEINRRLLDDVRHRFPGDEGRVQRISLVEEGSTAKSAWPTSPLSARTAPTGWPRFTPSCCGPTTVKDLADMFPERFNNKTNGVTPRRWLLEANPALARRDYASHRRWLDHRLEPAQTAQATGRGFQAFASAFLKLKARGQSAICQLAEGDIRAGCRPGFDLRLPDQTHPRIQTATAECSADRDGL